MLGVPLEKREALVGQLPDGSRQRIVERLELRVL
jgi:hypothetical protein